MPGHPDQWSSCITVMRRAATGPDLRYSQVSGKAVASGTLSPGSGRSPIRICLRYPADVRETPPNPGLQPGVTSTSDPCPESEDAQSVPYGATSGSSVHSGPRSSGVGYEICTACRGTLTCGHPVSQS